MKKMLFAAAAMIAAMTVNAATTTIDATWWEGVTPTDLVLDGASYKDKGGNTPGSLTDGVMTLAWAGQSTAGEIYKGVGGDYVRCNKSGEKSTISFKVAAGETVSVVFRNQKTSACTVSVVTGTGSSVTLAAKTGSGETAVVDEQTGTFTADANGDIKLTHTQSSLDIKSYTVGAATAANDAEADAEFAYSVKINGQKVNAKVYNEPVIEVSSNGAAKVVINKK